MKLSRGHNSFIISKFVGFSPSVEMQLRSLKSSLIFLSVLYLGLVGGII